MLAKKIAEGGTRLECKINRSNTVTKRGPDWSSFVSSNAWAQRGNGSSARVTCEDILADTEAYYEAVASQEERYTSKKQRKNYA
jgi:hypothetical protein